MSYLILNIQELSYFNLTHFVSRYDNHGGLFVSEQLNKQWLDEIY